ncbi:MAG: hypothetical protein CMH61_00355 [Nanoarchaeota archaeon]|nr:hypothetical protein [Nanoarchaeota archaeon]
MVELDKIASKYVSINFLAKVKGKSLGDITSKLAREGISHFIPQLQPDKLYIRSWTIQIPTIHFERIPEVVGQPDLSREDNLFYYASYQVRNERLLQEHPNWERFKRKNGLLMERTRIIPGYEG